MVWFTGVPEPIASPGIGSANTEVGTTATLAAKEMGQKYRDNGRRDTMIIKEPPSGRWIDGESPQKVSKGEWRPLGFHRGNSRAFTNTNYQQAFFAILAESMTLTKNFSVPILYLTKRQKKTPLTLIHFQNQACAHLKTEELKPVAHSGARTRAPPVTQPFKKTLDFRAVFLLKVKSNW